MKNKKILPIPKFKNEDAERAFWDTADTSLYFDWSKARHVKFPNLKFSTETISLRVPAGMLDDVKIQANKIDVPYQSLLKIYISGALEADKKNKFAFAS
ncbi:hypothetical protein A2130_02595 [Candidatus Woesebacteria bacterium GWC2_33_12]|uniref:Uncharacterized protein n=1 Tax=Candidatus Woesebacteria bacterium GW2011_GWB1_33_22 TaxID=1618566 RepID=A0A0G0BZ37_9BACT|nr:MAG: hypothetical protein UR29_C0013G0018 [Candidatus Woesebacteria bacterium GW2011_GWC2_33_12]KKP41704.1 MAG: hypothetical protein UR33_C0011G0019 [Candidatus Woesebacteria bacterium GW2011_GWA2_33_20]KKP44160.1 MAG: hypothetical protein UR35_C0011G0046 [Candidatus Woesebacteria bacterium GW2011_GWB1_33_22]KKP45819.1 MAG: hypothetical protein UR37_C0014G0046 [Microgenomates group bacterium GW2011_GWC1_33_28]KKP50241.1 MAG: hypothetical protein UR41_C0010G0045 [Candidatus Woesebacteria bact